MFLVEGGDYGKCVILVSSFPGASLLLPLLVMIIFGLVAEWEMDCLCLTAEVEVMAKLYTLKTTITCGW